MESMLWTRLTDGRLRCGLCAHACVLSPGQRGRCGVRCNHEGRPLSLVDGLVTGVQADPVEAHIPRMSRSSRMVLAASPREIETPGVSFMGALGARRWPLARKVP